MVDQWHQKKEARVIERQKTGQEQQAFLEELLPPDKSHPRLNGVTHRLDAFGFERLHLESKVNKKAERILTVWQW